MRVKPLAVGRGVPSTKANDKRRSVRVKPLAVPCGRFPARRPFLPAHPGRVWAFPATVSVGFTFTLNDTFPPLGVIADLIRNLLNRQRATLFFFLLLDEKEPKNQGRLYRASPRPSKGLTLRSRSTFCEGKRQALLREGQALSRPLQALPRPAAEARAPSPVEGRSPRARCPWVCGASRHVIPSLEGECIYACGLAVPCLCLVYALFMPCLCLAYTLFMPSMWVVCE